MTTARQQTSPIMTRAERIQEPDGQVYEQAGALDPNRFYVCTTCGAMVTWPSIVLHDAWHRDDRCGTKS